jgi:hypothetical protein
VRARISPLFCQVVTNICMGDSEKVFIIFYNLCRRIAKFQDHGVSEDSLSCGGRKDRIIGSFNNFINLLGSGYGISMCPELLIPCRNAQWPPKKVAMKTSALPV